MSACQLCVSVSRLNSTGLGFKLQVRVRFAPYLSFSIDQRTSMRGGGRSKGMSIKICKTSYGLASELAHNIASGKSHGQV